MAYRTRLLLTALSLFLFSGASAQDSLTVSMLVPDKAIKVSPLHLLNFYPTIEVSYEQKLWPDITAQFEVGWVVPIGNYVDDDFLNKRGVKLKLEGRYYFWGRTDRRKMYYLAVEPYMNMINFDRQRTRTECFDLECTSLFTRSTVAKMEYREQGVSVKGGLIRYWSKNIFIDVNSGFTFRNIRYTDAPPPPTIGGVFINDEGNFLDIPNEQDRIAIIPQLCARIGYRLK
jgi:hypothetical protein